MRFIPELDRPLVIEATRHTHALWSGGRDLADHTAHTLRQLDMAGPELLHYAGLADDAGLIASLKCYGVALAAPGALAGGAGSRGGGVIPALGIGAVFTREDARGRGAASALIREVLREARARGAGAAWLHAEIHPAMYERLGFRALPPWAWRVAPAALPAGDALSLRPAAPEDVERMIAWREQSFAGAPWVRTARSPESWRYFTVRNDVVAWILVDAGRDVGYLAACCSRAPVELWVDEWATPGVPRERVWSTLRAFAEREASPSVAGWLRPDHAGPPFERIPRPHAAVPMIAWLDPSDGSPGALAAAIPPERAHLGSFDYF